MTDLVIRALDEHDVHLFDALPDPLRAGETHRWVRYRPDWKRVALRDGRVVARAAWWGGPDDTEPLTAEWFDFADGEEAAGAELLRTAPWPVGLEINLPAGWRDDPGRSAAAEARYAAARAAGFTLFVERLVYRWTPPCGLPAPRPAGVRPRARRQGLLRRPAQHPLRHPRRPRPQGHRQGRPRPGRPGGNRLLPLVPLAPRVVAGGPHPGG